MALLRGCFCATFVRLIGGVLVGVDVVVVFVGNVFVDNVFKEEDLASVVIGLLRDVLDDLIVLFFGDSTVGF